MIKIKIKVILLRFN